MMMTDDFPSAPSSPTPSIDAAEIDHPASSHASPPGSTDVEASLSMQADMLASAAAAKAEKGQRQQRRPAQTPGGRRRFGSRISNLRSRATGTPAEPVPMDPLHFAEVRISERDARIGSLECELEATAGTVAELRSELVRLRASSREERYDAMEEMKLMREENNNFALRVVGLEEKLLRADSGPVAGGANSGGAADREQVQKLDNGGDYDSISGDEDGDFSEETIDGPSPPPPTAVQPSPSPSQSLPSPSEPSAPPSQPGAVTLDATYVAALRSQVDRCQKVILKLDEALGRQREHSESLEKRLRAENASLRELLSKQTAELDLKSEQLETVRHEARSEVEDLTAKLECKEATVRTMHQKILVGFERFDGEGVKSLREEIQDLKIQFSEAQGTGSGSEGGSRHGMGGFVLADATGGGGRGRRPESGIADAAASEMFDETFVIGGLEEAESGVVDTATGAMFDGTVPTPEEQERKLARELL